MSALELLLIQIDQAYDRRSWHGTNLRGSIRGVDHEAAVWRPAALRHNIQELVVHSAYWKYTVHRRFTGERRGSFPLAGSNWFVRDRADESQWKADVQLLATQHRLLREAVTRLDVRRLQEIPRGSRVSNVAMLSGILAHDLYHAGQIQLLKRLRQHAAPVP